MAGRQLSSSLVIQAYWTFHTPKFPQRKKKAPAFHIAQEAVRPTVYFDTNRLRDPIIDDGCLEIKPTIDRSLVRNSSQITHSPTGRYQRSKGFTAPFARRPEQWVMP